MECLSERNKEHFSEVLLDDTNGKVTAKYDPRLHRLNLHA